MRMPCCVASVTGRFPFLASASFVFIFLVLFSGEAKGDEFKIIPSLSTKEEYNDNIFFSQDDRKKDFVTTFSPALELIDRTERLDLNLSARVNVLRYWSNRDLDSVDQFYRGRIGYSLNPKLKISAEAGYTRDSTPDREIEVTGLVLNTVKRYKQNYAAGTEYTFSEKTKANLSYSYERSDYKDPGFADLTAHDINLGFIHDLSKYFSATLGRMNLGYSRYQSQDTTVDYYYATIGMSRALSEKWNILIDAGGSYTLQETSKGVDWVSQATLSYKGEKTNGELTFSHRMMPVTGTAGTAERTALTLNVKHRFTYEFSGRLSAGYYINKSEAGKFSTTPLDQATFSVTPVLRYEFTKDIALEASYNFALVKYKQPETEAQRNLFMINFIIQYPLFEGGRLWK
jgi:opacity protein-like surface antigen